MSHAGVAFLHSRKAEYFEPVIPSAFEGEIGCEANTPEKDDYRGDDISWIIDILRQPDEDIYPGQNRPEGSTWE